MFINSPRIYIFAISNVIPKMDIVGKFYANENAMDKNVYISTYWSS